ncbi:MAG: hypothetical protein RR283_15880, partial [Comamonas sp.]
SGGNHFQANTGCHERLQSLLGKHVYTMLFWNFTVRKRLREANSASMPYSSASKTVCAVQQKSAARG